MIRSWQKRFYETGSKTGIQPRHAKSLRLLLLQLAAATTPEDMDTPGNNWHKLVGNKKGFYSVKVSANWRVIFTFEGTDAILVDYLDYH